MNKTKCDPQNKLQTDETLVKKAVGLRETLMKMARLLKPFPGFMGMNTIQAIEVIPPGIQDSEAGCIVLCPDGEFYHLVLRLIPGPLYTGEANQVEDLRRVEMYSSDYIVYADAAIQELAQLLQEKKLRDQIGSGSG